MRSVLDTYVSYMHSREFGSDHGVGRRVFCSHKLHFEQEMADRGLHYDFDGASHHIPRSSFTFQNKSLGGSLMLSRANGMTTSARKETQVPDLFESNALTEWGLDRLKRHEPGLRFPLYNPFDVGEAVQKRQTKG